MITVYGLYDSSSCSSLLFFIINYSENWSHMISTYVKPGLGYPTRLIVISEIFFLETVVIRT